MKEKSAKDGARRPSPLAELRKDLLQITNKSKVHDTLQSHFKSGSLAPSKLQREDDGNVTINILKYVSRLHGLPQSFQKLLFILLKSPEATPQFKFKVSVALKYGVYHDPEFAKLGDIVQLLLKCYSLGEIGTTSMVDYFTQETIAQLLLATISILNPDRVAADESVADDQLWKLENYLPYIQGKYKSEIRRCLEKMGYWSGSITQRQGASFSATGGTNFVQRGEEIISAMQQKRGCRVSAHVVKTQQMESVTTEENVSEKTQMSNISLSNALEQGRARTMEAQRQREALPPPKTASGSDRWFYRSTAWELHNFLEKAKTGGAISPDDVEYLKDKLLGWKWSFGRKSEEEMIGMIGEIFFRIGKTQELDNEIVLSILKHALDADFKCPEAREHILQAVDFHCLRRKTVPQSIVTVLNDFISSSEWQSCSSECQQLVLQIFDKSGDDANIEETVKVALAMLDSPKNIVSALNCIQRVLNSEARSQILKESEKDLTSKLLSMALKNTTEENERLCSKCLEVLEDFMLLSWTQELTPDDCNSLLQIANNTKFWEKMKNVRTAAIRLLLKSLDKALKEPEFDKSSLNDQIGFLWQLMISKEEEIRTRVLILCIYANNFEKLSLASRLTPDHLENLLWTLKRKDVITIEDAQIFPEEHIENKGVPSENFEYLSTFAMKIILGFCQASPLKMGDEQIVSSVAHVLLTSPSKMTKILGSEYLFTLVKDTKYWLSSPVMNNIQGLTFSTISDVRVYTTSAYCTSLANQIGPLDVEYVNFLVDLYQSKKVILDKVDFSPYINPKILQCFRSACKSGLDVSEHVLHLTAFILNNTCADSESSAEYDTVKTTLETITFYCERRAATVPATVVEAVEHLLLESDVFDEVCAGIVEVCMGTGRWISDEVIDEFSKYLWHEPAVSIPFLRRLCLANENQDLPDSIFSSIQMELVSLSLCPPGTEGVEEGKEVLRKLNFNLNGDQQKLFQSLKQFVNEGMLMSKLSMEVVSRLLELWKGSKTNFEEVVECLTIASSNGQTLPKKIIEMALNQKIKVDFHVQLSFANEVVRRNQSLPEAFSQQLFKSLETIQNKKKLGTNEWKLLEVIKSTILHNQTLPPGMVRAFCLTLAKNMSQVSTGFLSAVIRIVQSGLEVELKICKEIFVWAAQCTNMNLREIGVIGLKALPESMLDQDDLQLINLSSFEFDEEEGAVEQEQAPTPKEGEPAKNIADIKQQKTLKKGMATGLTTFAKKMFGGRRPSKTDVKEELEVSLQSRLARWQANPKDKEITGHLKKLLKEEKVLKDNVPDIVTTLRNVNPKYWKTLPNMATVIAQYMVLEEGEGTTPEELEFLRNEVLQGEDHIPQVVLQALAYSLKSEKGGGDTGNLIKSLADYMATNQEKLSWQESKWICEIFKEVAASGNNVPPQMVDVVWKGILNEKEPLLRGECFQVMRALRRKKVQLENWDTLFNSVLCQIFRRRQVQEDDFTLGLLHTVLTLTYVDLEKIRKIEESHWVEDMMVTDTVILLAHKTDERYEAVVPVAKEFCRKVQHCSPQLRVYVLYAIVDFIQEHPGELSAATLLDFVSSAWDLKPKKENCWGSVFVKEAVLSGISQKICERIEGSFEGKEVVEMVEQFLRVGGSLGVLNRVTQVLRKSDFKDVKRLMQFVKVNREIVLNYLSGLKNRNLEGGVGALELFHSIRSDVLMELLKDRIFPKEKLFFRIESYVKTLLQRKLAFSQLEKLFKHLAEEMRKGSVSRARGLEILENVLYQLVAYEETPRRFVDLSGILLETKVLEWVFACNEKLMERLYSGSEGVKTSSTVYEEFVRENGQRSDESIKKEVESFEKIVRNVEPTHEFQSSFEDLKLKPVRDWSKAEIKKWAGMVRNDKAWMTHSVARVHEALAVISRACEIMRSYHLSPIQVLTTCLKDDDDGKGFLFQVATGSGKSTIIAALAVVRALQGLKVDIFTSSPVLAERDAKAWAPFYALFGLTCDHNGDKGSGYTRGEKNCYRKDIVYGDTAQFQFDALRHDYSGLGTRGKREYAWALVDEVDAMLVDDSSKLARLSSTIPGMDLLQIMYHLIWHRLHDVQQRMFAVGGIVYYLEGARKTDETGNLFYSFMGQEGKEQCVDNLPAFILARQNDTEELEKALIHKVNNIDTFVTDHLKKYTRALIGDFEFTENGRVQQKLQLPKPLVRFARSQVNNWVDSALTAVVYSENVHYIVDQEQIKPVDYRSTGTIQASTNWNNGLHQFLQIKHGLRVSTETVTTNFLSNMAMFQKYGSNIIGFTGTLGSKFGQQVLKEVYSVETLIIPELYYKRFHELSVKVTSSKKEWLDEVVHSALHESVKKRGVLVICQTIRDADLIAEEIERTQAQSSRGPKERGNVKLYTRNDRHEEKKVEKIYEGDIIVATNLAGRGTDINTVNIEDHGGLHVVLTFMPDSLRVEQQAFGRTARQGKKGTGELIMIHSSQEFAKMTSEELKSSRDKEEQNQLTEFQKKELVLITLKDKLFSRFCKVFSEIRHELNGIVWNLMGREGLTPLEQTQLQAIEQEWAFFLKKVDDSMIIPSNAIEEYNKFEEVVLATYKDLDKTVSRTDNCFYWIQVGNEYYGRSNNFSDNTLKALDSYEKAIAVDDFGVGGEAGIAFCLLRGGRRYFRENSHRPRYKHEAIEHLNKALEKIFEEIGLYSTAQTLHLQRKGRMDSELLKFLTEKINLLGDYSNTLQAIVRMAEQSLRRAWVTQVDSSGSETSWKLDDENPVSSIQGCDSNCKYTLAFHDLTSFYDLWTQDQAANIVELGKKIGIKVSNANLKNLAEAVEKQRKTFDRLEVNGVTSIEVARELLEKLSPKSYAVKMSPVSQEVAQQVSNLVGGGDKVTVDWVDGETKWKSGNIDGLPANCKANLEVTLEKVKDLEGVKGLWDVEKTEISLVLLDVKRSRVVENWDENADESSVDKKAEEKEPGILQSFSRNTVTMTGLSKGDAKKILEGLRAKHIHFVLQLESMNLNEAIHAIKKADRKSEDIEEKGVKKMGEQFSSTYVPVETLRDLAQRGLVLMPTFSEKQFIPWRSAVVMGIIATAQVAAGGALICTGFGATVGMGMITEGVSDYMTTYRVVSTRHFSWTDYAIQKSISLTISCVTMGVSALKDGAKGAQTLVEAGATEVLEQAGTKVATSGKTLNEALKVASGNLKSLTGKFIGVKVGETAARAALNGVVNSALEFSFDQVKSYILTEVDKTVTLEFGKEGFKKALSTCVAMDRRGITGSKVSGWTNEVIASNSWIKYWDSVGLPLIQGIFSDPSRLTSVFSMAARLFSMGMGVKEIATVTGKVCDHIRKKLESEYKDPVSYAIQDYFGVKSDVADKVVNMMTFNSKSDFDASKFPGKDELTPLKIEKKELEDLFKTMRDKKRSFLDGKETEKASRLIASVVNPVTDHIIQVANRQLAQPMTTFAVGALVSKISQEIQGRFLVSDSQLSDDQRRTKELRQKDPASLTPEEKEFLGRQPSQILIADQIRGNAKDFTIAYQKRDIIAVLEMANPSEKLPPPGTLTDEQEKAIFNLVLGGSPADMTTVFVLAKLNNIDVKLVDDVNYEPTQEEKEKGTQIIIWQKGQTDNDVGHYLLKDRETGKVLDFVGGKDNDCAFNVLSSLTGKSPDSLRREAAMFVACNKEVFERTQESVTWLQDRYPQEACKILHVGGEPHYDTEYHAESETENRINIVWSGDDEEEIEVTAQRIIKVVVGDGKGSSPMPNTELGRKVTAANDGIKNAETIFLHTDNGREELRQKDIGQLCRGHLGNAKEWGVEGEDKNMAVITKATNTKMYHHFEKRGTWFADAVKEAGLCKEGDTIFEVGFKQGPINDLVVVNREGETTRVPLADNITCCIKPKIPEGLTEQQQTRFLELFEQACSEPVLSKRDNTNYQLYPMGQGNGGGVPSYGMTFSNRNPSEIMEPVETPTGWEPYVPIQPNRNAEE